jgi:hypothetical protein
MQLRGDQSGEVRHVHQEVRPGLVGDPAERGEVQLPGYADQPAMTSFGRCSLASDSTAAMSTRWSLSRTWYAIAR